MLFLAILFLFNSCETFDLDQLENPSTVSDEKLQTEYVFNYIQLKLPDFVDRANSFTQRVTRQMAMTGGNTYENAFSPSSSDGNWRTGYLLLNAIKTMQPKAIENNQYFMIGASKVIRCYVLMTMVDMYGDIPYSEALLGNENQTPKYDNSASIYAGIYNELNDAIENLNREGIDLSGRDYYYGSADATVGNPEKWVKLANTLKLKMLNNARLVGSIGNYNVTNEITNLLTENNLINDISDDFAFRYGTDRTVNANGENSRHPQYNDQYGSLGGDYIANYFMWAVSKEKNKPAKFDPREDFYFYKLGNLSTTFANLQNVPCNSSSKKPIHFNSIKFASFYDSSIKATFCYSDFTNLGNSYLGRDHGDNSGIPTDVAYRTVCGIYPCGGKISSSATNIHVKADEEGALGQGIMPILLSSYVHFIKAEAILTLNLTASTTPLDELKLAIDQSIVKTTTFLPLPSSGAPTVSDTNTKKTNYIAFIESIFNTSNSNKKLELIEKEFYIASWGNGIEPYNNYRRTGFPSNFQPTVEENSGVYFSTAYYPFLSVNNNPNAPSNVRTKKVFWDVAALTLN